MARRGGRQDLYLTVGGTVDPLKAAMTAGRSVLNEFGLAAINTSAEVEKAFQNLGGNVPAQAKALEQAYARSFAEIRANAQAALNAPSGTGAIEILNAAGARQAAEAAEAKAAALRIVADAAQRAAGATEGDSAANRVFAISAEAAAQGARDEAEALRAQANVLSGVEAKLEGVTGAQRRNIVVTGQQRAGMQQLSYNVGDIATQFAAGTPPMIIFAQQGGQVIQALSLMTTETSGFLGFLGGPWGIALSSAAVVLTPLIGKLFEEGEAAKEAAKQEKAHKEAIDALIEAQGKAVLSTEAKLRADFIELERERQKEERIRRTTAALLEQAKVKLEAAQASASDPTLAGEGGFNPGAAVSGAIAGQISTLQTKIDKNDKRIAELTTASTRAGGRYIASIVEANSTPEGSLRREYQLLEAAAEAELERTKDFARYSNTLARLEDAHQAELKSLQEAQRKGRGRSADSSASDRATDLAYMEAFLRRELPGVRITSTTNHDKYVKGTNRISDHYERRAIDFVPAGGMGSMSKDQIRELFESNGLRIRRNKDGVEQLFGPGDKGHSNHFHVAWDGRAPSAATSARHAESDRQRELAEDISFANEEKQLRHRLLDLQARTAANEEERNRLLEADIDAEAAAYATKVKLAASAGKLDDKEAESLLQLNEKVRLQRRDNLKLEQLGRTYDQQFERQSRSLDYDIQMLRLQYDLAKTTAERKRIAEELLAAEQKQRRQALERVRDHPNSSADQVQQAKESLARLPEIEQGERKQDLERNLSPLGDYRSRLEKSVGDMNDALEGVKVHGLETLEDELTAVIMGTESVADAFKKMAASIIADLIRIAIQKAILAAIGGGDTSTGGGGDFFSSLFGGGRAGGGSIDPNKFYLVGERGPELFAPGQSGTIIPNHVLSSASMRGVPRGVSRGPRSGEHDVIEVRVSGSELLQVQIERTSARAVASATPGIAGSAAGMVIKRLKRPSLG